MEKTQENKVTPILCTPLIHMVDEAGERVPLRLESVAVIARREELPGGGVPASGRPGLPVPLPQTAGRDIQTHERRPCRRLLQRGYRHERVADNPGRGALRRGLLRQK